MCAGAQFEAALMGMYDFAAGDKLLNDKLQKYKNFCAILSSEFAKLLSWD